MYTHSKEFRDKLTPDQALSILKEGNDRFVRNLVTNRNLLQQVNATADGQFPFATILSCMDSRTSAELIFDQGLGDIFSIRVAGNVVNSDILGSMEFATKVVGTKLILVLGHTKCGAIAGACNGVEMGHLTGLLQKIRPAMEAANSGSGERSDACFVDQVTRLNVELCMDQIRRESDIIIELEQQGRLSIKGGIYNVENGAVTFFD